VFVTLQSPSRARNFRTAARHSLPSCAAAQPRSLEGTLILASTVYELTDQPV